jgi:hypothetical protein
MFIYVVYVNNATGCTPQSIKCRWFGHIFTDEKCIIFLLHHCFLLKLCFINNVMCLLVLYRISGNKSVVYRAIINNKLVYLWMVRDTNLKEFEKNTETHKANIGSIHYNTLAASKCSVHCQRKMVSQVIKAWLPWYPDLIPCGFYLRGCVKDQVYQPLMPQFLQKLWEWISQPMTNVDESQLWHTRKEWYLES